MSKTIRIMVAVLVMSIGIFGGTVHTQAKVKIKAPTITVKKRTKTAITLKLSSNDKKTTGFVLRKKNANGKYVKVKTIKMKKGKSGVSYKVKKLSKGTTYYFSAVATTKIKGKKYTSKKAYGSVKTKGKSSSSSDSSDIQTVSASEIDKIEEKIEKQFKADNYAKIEAENYQQKMLDKINIFRKQAGVPEMVLDKDLNTLSYIRGRAKAESKFSNPHDEYINYEVNYYLDLSDESYYFAKFSENWGLGSESENFNINWISESEFDQYQKVVYSDYPSKYKYTANNETYVLIPATKNAVWRDVLCGWMDSDGHRKNLLNEDWTHFGVANYKGNWYQSFVDSTSKRDYSGTVSKVGYTGRWTPEWWVDWL